jgi:hypothetical protein
MVSNKINRGWETPYFRPFPHRKISRVFVWARHHATASFCAARFRRIRSRIIALYLSRFFARQRAFLDTPLLGDASGDELGDGLLGDALLGDDRSRVTTAAGTRGRQMCSLPHLSMSTPHSLQGLTAAPLAAAAPVPLGKCAASSAACFRSPLGPEAQQRGPHRPTNPGATASALVSLLMHPGVVFASTNPRARA